MVLRVITFKADERLIEQLDLLAKEMGISRSEVIRLAIENLIEARMREKNEIETVPVTIIY